MTDFSNICSILGELFSNYKQDPAFIDFIEFNDLGLPLAYFVSENLCEASPDGEKYIAETWDIFLASVKIEDEGFSSLDEIFSRVNPE